MKHLPLIIAIVALAISILAYMDAHETRGRLEEFGLRPHPQ
jgi:hypothetical protein